MLEVDLLAHLDEEQESEEEHEAKAKKKAHSKDKAKSTSSEEYESTTTAVDEYCDQVWEQLKDYEVGNMYIV